MRAKFDAGDLVELKSGGPVMTVNSVSEPAYGDDHCRYLCKWFAGKTLKKEWLDEPALRAAKEIDGDGK